VHGNYDCFVGHTFVHGPDVLIVHLPLSVAFHPADHPQCHPVVGQDINLCDANSLAPIEQDPPYCSTELHDVHEDPSYRSIVRVNVTKNKRRRRELTSAARFLNIAHNKLIL